MYEAPSITDFGSIATHTFQTPGQPGNTKSVDPLTCDKFQEPSHDSGPPICQPIK